MFIINSKFINIVLWLIVLLHTKVSAQSINIFYSDVLFNTTEIYLELATQDVDTLSVSQGIKLAEAQYFLDLEVGLANTLSSIDPQSITEPFKQYSLLYLQAMSAAQAGEYSKSIETLESSLLVLLTEEGHDFIRIIFAQELARNYAILGNYKKAYEIINEYHSIAQKKQDKFGLGLINYTHGLINYFNDDVSGSLEYYQDALDSFKELKYPFYIADAHLGLATSYSKLGKFEKALAAFNDYEEALSYRQGFGSTFYLHYGKAMLFNKYGNCEEALGQIDKALSSEGPNDYKSELYKVMSSCFLAQKNMSGARQAIDKAIQFVNEQPELKNTIWEADLMYIRSQVLKSEGQFPESLDILEKYIELYKKIIADAYSKDLAELKTEFSTRQKDLEIEVLEQRTTKQYYFVIVIGLLALVLLFPVFWYRKRAEYFSRLSNTDPLTGLFNRRHSLQVLNYWLSYPEAFSRSWCLAMCDIDNFKAVNDSFGHNIGDEVIKNVANKLAKNVRAGDVVARFGGEEFIIAMPRLSLDEAQNVLERIRGEIASSPTITGLKEIQNTISIGMVMVESNDLTISEWLALADEALYQAKRLGKNRVEVSVVK